MLVSEGFRTSFITCFYFMFDWGALWYLFFAAFGWWTWFMWHDSKLQCGYLVNSWILCAPMWIVILNKVAIYFPVSAYFPNLTLAALLSSLPGFQNSVDQILFHYFVTKLSAAIVLFLNKLLCFMQLIIVQKEVCSFKFRFSESSMDSFVCMVSQLQWILVLCLLVLLTKGRSTST
jgi:hypothetical protein